MAACGRSLRDPGSADLKGDLCKTESISLTCRQAVSMFGSSLVQYAIVWYVAKETNSGLMFSHHLSGFCLTCSSRYSRVSGPTDTAARA